MNDTSERFAFGKNWEAFLSKYTSERLKIAQQRLLNLLRLSDLEGKTFLDIGSGSGLHSLAAWSSGAANVLSFDYDINSVNATRTLWEKAGKPDNWRILQGSVLDAPFMRSLGSFDIVYSWGVLHHTGDMWQAIRNARLPLSENGVFCIALYSNTNYQNGTLHGSPTPEEWLRIKQKYNKASTYKKRLMEYAEVWRCNLWPFRRNPLRFVRACIALGRNIYGYKKYRGMDFMTDVRDWLGGWPMDFVKESAMTHFCKAELGLEPLDMITGEGNTEFLFRPLGSSNYWDTLLEKRTNVSLPASFRHVQGHMWACPLPELAASSDTQEFPRRSPLMLFEDGLPLDFNHAPHDAVRLFGEGRYSHWGEELFFSSSDNSDPNTNGRIYTAMLWC
jgi:SAM-dependent methyltransferase